MKKLLFYYLVLILSFNLNAQCWQTVSKSSHIAAIRIDGSLWTWGNNYLSGTGDYSLSNNSTPIRIGCQNDWKFITTAVFRTAAIKYNGTLWIWGYNYYGQLGDGTLVDKNVPTQVGSATDWTDVSISHDHTLALKSNGTLWAWGNNDVGQLGDGTYLSSSVPIQIGTDNNWKQVDAGDYHSLALKNDGTLWSWGFNSSGQLGTGNMPLNSNVPNQVGSDTWTQISAGYGSSFGIKTNGTLWAWGVSLDGALGVGCYVSPTIPTQIGTDNNWKSVSAGYSLTAALKNNGTLWTWGNNMFGGLGIGNTINQCFPVQVGTDTDWAIAESNNSPNTLALKNNKTLWIAGINDWLFGNGTGAGSSSIPVQINALNCSPINAQNDTFTANPSTTTNTTAVFTNDTNNGVNISSLTGYTLTQLQTVTPTPSSGSIVLNSTNGIITVAAGTTCGTYTLKYQLCPINSCPTCSNVATVTIVVGNANSLPLTAIKDKVCLIPGTSSNVSILSNDTVNGLSANGSNVSITTIGSIPSGISVNANGFVTVSAGTAAGAYTFSYKICNLCNPSNCSNATNVSVNVYSTTLRANNDIVFSDSTGAIRGGGYNVLSNDYNLCPLVNPNTVTITITSANPNFTINTTPGANFGNVTVNPNLPTGNYSLTYQICEISNPTSCSSATVTLTVGLTLGSRADNTVRTTNLYGVNNDVIITGDFTSYNGIVRNKIAKLNNNNLSLNTSFGSVINFGPSHPILTTNLIKTVFVDGNVIYVGGDFTNFNNTAKNRIAKLDGDTGNLISVFDARFNNTVYDIKKQGNKLIVVGDFLYRDATGLRRKGIARIDPITGAIDSSFLINLPGTDGAINAVEFLSDGNMIIAGNFSYYNNVLVNGIAKINPDGNLITSFNAGGTRFNITTPGNNKIVEKMLVRGNSIYIAGFFANYNGVPVGNIVKLSTVTGAIDSIFNNTTVGANAPIFSMISESGTNDSGTLLLGGYFSSYNTPLNNIPYLIRINNNGSLNTSLVGNINISGPASLGGSVFSMVQQPDGKLIFGGNFTSVNSIPANRITRLNTSTGVQAKMTDNENLSNNTIENEVNIYPNPSKGIFTIYFVEKMENENNISVYNMLGQKILDYLVSEIETFDLNLSNYANGTYFVKISNGLKTITKKVIKQ
ncbi:T9SS type A sorting domain-containing protein [Flavobacterium sp.]|jgi:hypothetical protein|uniref:RCC1 domain-containing protein n=1 Tax=Flavobacterium sp. TaxID=239 RepID=UPI0037C01F4C